MSKKEEVVLETGEKIESIGPWRIAWRKFCDCSAYGFRIFY